MQTAADQGLRRYLLFDDQTCIQHDMLSVGCEKEREAHATALASKLMDGSQLITLKELQRSSASRRLASDVMLTHPSTSGTRLRSRFGQQSYGLKLQSLCGYAHKRTLICEDARQVGRHPRQLFKHPRWQQHHL